MAVVAFPDDTVVIDLGSAPPSTNGLFKNIKGGRAKDERYITWLNAVGWDVKAARVKPIHHKVAVTILVERPNRRSDIDNRLKAPLDLLVRQGVLLDDSQIERVTGQWSDAIKGCRIFIERFRKGESNEAAA